ncbi:hypothetical protein [Sphingopyxis sp. C-1]|uniref:hypothetical protein n=1 Tax=Sphingopyxis sp. C-1 TaxID=262667 RepID=UPI00078342E8|nr:hypothetical protein [Sphingopyxis sp. C-1]
MNANAKKPEQERDPIRDIVANAVDFLESATREFRKGRPKPSIIAFHSAVELFLKARLMHEHWSLVVSKGPSLTQFQSGDFVSVTFEEACDRLVKIVGHPLPERARRAFDALRKHRNKLVHFFQDLEAPGVKEQIAEEQLHAWHALSGLLSGPWREIFERFDIDIAKLDRGFADHRLYLQTRFDSLCEVLADLKKSGADVRECGACKYQAAEVETVVPGLFDGVCHVCRYATRWLMTECSDCEKPLRVTGDENSLCGYCLTNHLPGDIAERIDQDPATYDDMDKATPANCSWCDGYQTVVMYQDHYICTACLELTGVIGICGWCSEGNNGDMEGSTWKGCNFCDGRAGWERD